MACGRYLCVVGTLIAYIAIQWGCSTVGSAGSLAGDGRNRVVAFTPDIPPYVMKNATDGVEVALVRELLGGFKYHVIQIPYGELQNAIRDTRADIAVPVQPAEDGVFYSNEFITFHNAAISKKADAIHISTVVDLKSHRVLAWQNAYEELGTEFTGLYSPKGSERGNYQEIGNQEKQVQMFWEGENTVIVIDRNIFNYISRQMGHSLDEADVHLIFPPNTRFRVGFKEEAIRDLFNQRLAELRKSGDYERLLEKYQLGASK